jgi:hypothetical protein
MPTIALDARRWEKVNPVEDEIVTVKALNNACYYSNAANPPELEFPGKPVSGPTELTENSEVTVEGQAGKWFVAKLTSEERKGEALAKPCVLEVTPTPFVEGQEQVTTAMLDKEAVTATKIGGEAVTASKIKSEAVTAAKLATNAVENAAIKNEAVTTEKGKLAANATKPGAEGEISALSIGIPRWAYFSWNAKKEAKAKIKLNHGISRLGAAVVAVFKAGVQVYPTTTTAQIETITRVSATELEVTLKEEATAGGEEWIFVVAG